MRTFVCSFILIISFISCNPKDQKKSNHLDINPQVQIVGALKNVMRKGDLTNRINTDTINKKNLYGIGPLSGLKGEIMIIDGNQYVSSIISDSTLFLGQFDNIRAPFFVYVNVNEWLELKLDSQVKSIKDLEVFIDRTTSKIDKPFAFKLNGKVSNAKIHVQNLAEGTKISSPKDAHSGQVNFMIENEIAEIIGFFSRKHQAIFTHHDSYLHMHLITNDKTKMGHLDELEISDMKLYIQK